MATKENKKNNPPPPVSKDKDPKKTEPEAADVKNPKSPQDSKSPENPKEDSAGSADSNKPKSPGDSQNPKEAEDSKNESTAHEQLQQDLPPLHTRADDLLELIIERKSISIKDAAHELQQTEEYIRRIADVFQKHDLVDVEVTGLKMIIKLNEGPEEEEDGFHHKAKDIVDEAKK